MGKTSFTEPRWLLSYRSQIEINKQIMGTAQKKMGKQQTVETKTKMSNQINTKKGGKKDPDSITS